MRVRARDSRRPGAGAAALRLCAALCLALAAGCGLAYPIVAIVAATGGGGGGGSAPPPPLIAPVVEFLGSVGGTQSGTVAVPFTISDVYGLPCVVTVTVSLDGGASFRLASGAIFSSRSPPPRGSRLTGSLPTGIDKSYLFEWDSDRDLPTQATPVAILRFVADDRKDPPSAPADTAIAVDNQLHADLVLGQSSLSIGGLDNRGFDEAVSISAGDGHLWVCDYSNHRVLQFNEIPTFDYQGADRVIGQADFTHGEPEIFLFPSVVKYDVASGRLFVGAIPDIFVWQGIPLVNGQAPDYHLFVDGDIHDNFTGLAIAGDDLYVVEGNENRCLRYELGALPPRPPPGETALVTLTADLIIGQATITETASIGFFGDPATDVQHFAGPRDVRIVPGSGPRDYQVVVSDSGDSRLLVWHRPPGLADGVSNPNLPAADFQIGVEVPDGFGGFNTCSPEGLALAPDGRVFVGTDDVGLLVLDGLAPDAVTATMLPTFDAFSSDTPPDRWNVAGSRNSTQSIGMRLDCDADHLFIADDGFNRAMVFSPVPTLPAPGAPTPAAVAIVGQPSGSDVRTDHAIEDAFSLNFPSGIATDGTRLLVSDTRNSRVLIWSTLPSSDGIGADLCLGKTSLFGGFPSDHFILTPKAVATDGTHIFVCDADSTSVDIWNTFPTTSGTAYDLTITSVDASGVAYDRDAQLLAVSDLRNNRVLVWHHFDPEALVATGTAAIDVDFIDALNTSNFSPPDVVLGQPDGVSSTADNPDLPRDAQMHSPTALWFDSVHRLYVCEGGRRSLLSKSDGRVLIFSPVPVSGSAGVPATAVVIPPTTPDLGTTGVQTGVTYFEDGLASKLIMVDTENKRVLFWDWDGFFSDVPTSDNVSGLFGQRSLETREANQGGITDHSLYTSSRGDPIGDRFFDNPLAGVCVTGSGDGAVMWIVDARNDRVLRVPFKRP